MPSFLKWAVLLLNWPAFVFAQLQITHPMPRLVVQRGTDGTGRLYITGRLAGAADRVEAQLTPVSAGQGSATPWQTVQTNPANGLFLGYITGPGGWYVLTVRTIVNNTITEFATVQPVGIGEVFITAGQSNSRGLGFGDNDLGTATGRVVAIDSTNDTYPPGAVYAVSSGDPFPVPVFKTLTAGRRIYPRAESSWGWGELGDYIVNRYNVPVAFYVAGWDGSTAENWHRTANGLPTCNRYWCDADWPYLQPYTNLKHSLQYYASVSGVRAVLWHQGEAEYDYGNGSSSVPQYYDRLVGIVQKSRQDFNGRNLPWVVARASRNNDNPPTLPQLIAEQQRVIDTPGLNVFQGPYNDTIVNRNAGDIDVHFRNAFRPTPHPQYYLNPNSIPANMGLSRFARNWNASLNNAFFQNAQPSVPSVFAATGSVASYVLPGDSLFVPFVTSGTFNAGNVWQVQLLDSLGRYISTLGSGPASPVRVKLPGSYQSGRYQVRVVASSPALPAVPSNLFRITTNIPLADVSLSMQSGARTLGQSGPVGITLLVHNAGPGAVGSVTVRDRLPANLTVLNAPGLSVSNGVLTGTLTNVAAGATVPLSFTVQPTAVGQYRNAAEISQSSMPDPDSQPNSGTGDGQDDAAIIDFRTTQSGGGIYVSPNPDQVPLPAVQSNQPAPSPTKADISLSLTVSNRSPRLNDVVSYSLTLTNVGGQPATNLNVAAYLPASQTFVPGDNLIVYGASLVGSLNSLDAGSSYTFMFRARATAIGRGICAAQLTSATPADPDSTPNNGTTNGEDDTAQLDVRVR
ncbi:sialate O-acetylesterase [Spirosoma montaniterrae]|uniref:DUF11 domain-containing protein n=1 Tax=Spirosoma montaniterrae TaxID=1178516 RepID=A0A1P9X2A8_9BACT|nr:sialate O-acetylesterase [Spirosoma montaniterrae]AQG81725.1 hypothetical protein AWR27_21925 [Spirosoma montaniterrae]